MPSLFAFWSFRDALMVGFRVRVVGVLSGMALSYLLSCSRESVLWEVIQWVYAGYMIKMFASFSVFRWFLGRSWAGSVGNSTGEQRAAV